MLNTDDLSLITTSAISGYATWELTRIIVGRNGLGQLPILLTSITEKISRLGASRVLVTIKENADLGMALIKSGFKFSHTESLYTGKNLKPNPINLDLRPKIDIDDLAIFRLYNLATPIKIRSLNCPTLADWKALNRQHKDVAHEYVMSNQTEAKMYLKIIRNKEFKIVTIIVHPQLEYNVVKHLLQFSLSILTDTDKVRIFIPEFQTSFNTAVAEIGLPLRANFQIYSFPIAASEKLLTEESAVGFVT